NPRHFGKPESGICWGMCRRMALLHKSLDDAPNFEESESHHNDSVNSGFEDSNGDQLEDVRSFSPSRIKGAGTELSPRKLAAKTKRSIYLEWENCGKTAQLLTATGPKTNTEGANFEMAWKIAVPSKNQF
ncbi:unnamed protein product, partial [Allacma fusca]